MKDFELEGQCLTDTILPLDFQHKISEISGTSLLVAVVQLTKQQGTFLALISLSDSCPDEPLKNQSAFTATNSTIFNSLCDRPLTQYKSLQYLDFSSPCKALIDCYRVLLLFSPSVSQNFPSKCPHQSYPIWKRWHWPFLIK